MVTIVIVGALMIVICVVIRLLDFMLMTCMSLAVFMSKNCRSGKIETERNDQRKQKAINLLHERSPSMQMKCWSAKTLETRQNLKTENASGKRNGRAQQKKTGVENVRFAVRREQLDDVLTCQHHLNTRLWKNL